jgi:DNA-binding transcriptional ArsR family regulator
MKHLKVLEEAGLVITRREGREKLHFLNAVPIRQIHDRWIDKYREHQVSALVDLKQTLEKQKWSKAKKTA